LLLMAMISDMTTIQIFRALAAALIGLASGMAGAHEFWITAAPFKAPAAAMVHLDLYVGQFFDGELIPLTAEYVTQFQRFGADGTENLMRRVPRSGATGIILPLDKPGTQILAIDTHPNFVKLSSDQFTYYLADEGLTQIRMLREQRQARAPVKAVNRERYRRHIKALVQIGDLADGTALMKTGQRLEIVPLADPRQSSRTAPTAFQVLFEGKPLAGVLIKAWNKTNGQTVLLRAVADETGVAMITLPFPGMWMLSAVHMLPVQNDPALDWESLWANLSFEIP
jgi:hypothetical protein